MRFGFVEQLSSIETIKDLATYTLKNTKKGEKELYKYNKIHSKKQFVFIHMVFDGTNLKYKDIAIDSIGYKNDGEIQK